MASDTEVITASVRQALRDEVSEDFVLHLLAELRTNMRDAERSTRRATGLILLLSVTFELASRRGILEASFYFFKLESLDFVLFAIPVIIAYLCYAISGHVADSNDLYWVHTKVVQVRYPTMWASNLHLFLIPVNDPFGQSLRGATFGETNGLLLALGWARFPLHAMIPSLAAYAFEVYALIQLFLHFGAGDILVWVSCLITVCFLFLALAGSVTVWPHKENGVGQT